MKIDISIIKYEDKHVLRNLLGLYNYDLAEFNSEDIIEENKL